MNQDSQPEIEGLDLDALLKVALAVEGLDEEYDESTPVELAAIENFSATFDQPTVMRLLSALLSLKEGGGLRAQSQPSADAGTHIPRSPDAPSLAGWALLTDDQRADIEAHIDGLTIADTKPYERPAHGWTCFHCGETFKTRGGGVLHFGQKVTGRPACDVVQPIIEAADAADAATWQVTTWAVPVADLRRFRDAHQTLPAGAARQLDDAMREAVGLARSLHARFYANVTRWQPLDDTRGVISQIDNMVAGMTQRLEAAETGRDNLRSAVLWALGEGDDFPLRQDGEGAYWSRRQLRARAFPEDREGEP